MTKFFYSLVLFSSLLWKSGDFHTHPAGASGNINRYDSIKASVQKTRKQMQAEYAAANDSVKKLLVVKAKGVIEETLLNEIIPCWYGTLWDFEGYTAVPKKGKIACGYFVSTTLLHAGFKLNRYTIAQKKPYLEALSYNFSAPVTSYENLSKPALMDSIMQDKFEEGIYFVGLDFHVGFLLKTKEELFFIHSNYINKAGVMREKASESEAFGGYSFYLVPLTTNPTMVKAWMLQKEIKTIHSP